jgi:hypothetical protein
MAVDIKVTNDLPVNAPYTYLSTPSTAGGTTLNVKNINAFSASDAIQIGKTGQEQTEIVLLHTATPSGTALNTAATTRFSHPIDTPVYKTVFNQIIYKVSTSGTAGTATAITNGTITITPDSDYTLFSHSTGASTYAYKTSYYNSVTTSESSDSDWNTPLGYSFHSLARIRERAKNKLYAAGYIKDDGVVDEWINEWMEELNNTAVQVDQSYSLGSTNVTFGTAGLGTITDSDFKEIKRVWITYNGNDDYKAAKIDVSGYWPEDVFSAWHPYYYNYGDNIIGVKPAESGGTAKIVYYKLQSPLDSDADELPYSMRGYSNSFVDYCVAQAYYLDNKQGRGDRFMTRANNAKEVFKNQITPRGKDGVVLIDMITPLHADDYDLDTMV